MTLLGAAGIAFLSAGGALYAVARRHLLLCGNGDGRARELRLSLVVSLLTFGGFALAHVGMGFSWTGTSAFRSLDWLLFAVVFVALVLGTHVLLRLQRSRADQVVLPVAAFLALLGLLNTYVWETRDANAYVSTVALPAMRSFAADRNLRIRALIPNELVYERTHPGGSATVLDNGWLASYNAAARRFSSVPGVHRVRLHARLERQLIAVGLGLLLIPFVLSLWARIRTPQKLDGVALEVVGTLSAVGLICMSFLSSTDRHLPALLEFRGQSITIFELLKIALVVVLAAVFSSSGAGRRRRGVALVAVGGTIGAMAWRDTGAGVALLSVALLMLAVVLRRRGRIAIVLAAAVVLALAPAAADVGRAYLPAAVRVRLAMWTDPIGFYERARIRNDVAEVLQRLVASSQPPRQELVRRSVQGRSHRTTVHLTRDVEEIVHELRWRLDQRLRGASRFKPFIPGASRTDDLLLLEAERLWSDLGGFSARSPDELVALSDRVADAIRRLRSQAAQVEAGLRVADARLAADLARPARLPPEVAAVAPDNFQLERSLYALRAGGALGVGLGQGRPESVPRISEDADTVALGESFGLAGIVLVALFVALLAGRAGGLMRTRRDTAGLLAVGLGGLLGLQALIRLGGVSGLLPFTGLTFPFLGRSGTGLVADFLIVALLMAISTQRSGSPAHETPVGGFALAFIVVVVPIALLQLTGRSLASGPLFSPLPGARSAFLHASDQWDEPSYRTAPGSIVDRRGRVLARTTTLGGARDYPNEALATELGHTLLQLDFSFRDRLRARARGASGVGPTLVTTLDSGVEEAISDAFDQGSLQAGLSDPKALRGAVVVLDVKSGGLVALASRPTFSLHELSDPTAWAAAEARERRSGFPYRYLNRAIHGFYPPGSIFKIVTAAGVLERGFHTLHSRDFDYRKGPTARRRADGADHLGLWHQLPLPDGQPITDGNHPQLANWDMTLEEAFAWSCNVAFAQLGLQLGAADLIGFARRFGFERPLDVPGLGAATSTIDNHPERPTGARYVARTKSNLARTAFGQGQARVTPLQMALVAAAIANGGTIMQPHIVAGWRSAEGQWLERERAHSLIDTHLSRLTIADLRELMWRSVTYGWARTARVNAANAHPGVAGKTGSAEWSETRDAAHSWFIGYYPAERPRVALAVVVERGGAGPTVAGRIAHDIFASPALARYTRTEVGR